MTSADGLAAHRWLCRTLSPYEAHKPVVAPDPNLWPEIIRLSDSWLVSARLAHRLSACDFVPPEAREILGIIETYSRDRADLMRHELSAVIAALNEIGVQPVVMKGAEWLLGHYCPEANKVMTDLDIWIPSTSDQMPGLEALERIGYVPMQPWLDYDLSNSHHFPPLHRDGAIARLEVHHNLIRSTLVNMMGLADAKKRLVLTENEGLSYYRLAPQDGILLAYLQSGHMAAPSFDTRKVTVSKWLDFLDRVFIDGPAQIADTDDIGLRVKANEIDRQLLTVLQDFFGLPYTGPRDTGYIDSWTEKMSPERLILRGFIQSATWKNILSLSRWVSFIKGFKGRVKNPFFVSKL